MSLSKYFILLGLCTAFCWFAFFLVVFLMNPHETGFLAFLLFYLSLGFATLGSASIFVFWIKTRVNKDEMPHKLIKSSTRQAFVIALLIVIALLLQSFRLLTWWNLLILIFVAGAAETILISAKRDT